MLQAFPRGQARGTFRRWSFLNLHSYNWAKVLFWKWTTFTERQKNAKEVSKLLTILRQNYFLISNALTSLAGPQYWLGPWPLIMIILKITTNVKAFGETKQCQYLTWNLTQAPVFSRRPMAPGCVHCPLLFNCLGLSLCPDLLHRLFNGLPKTNPPQACREWYHSTRTIPTLFITRRPIYPTPAE